MDGEVGLVLEQRDFKLLGEQPFGQAFALLGERGGLQFIAGGLDDFQLELEFRENGPALGEHGVGLREGEGAAAGGDE